MLGQRCLAFQRHHGIFPWRGPLPPLSIALLVLLRPLKIHLLQGRRHLLVLLLPGRQNENCGAWKKTDPEENKKEEGHGESVFGESRSRLQRPFEGRPQRMLMTRACMLAISG